MKTVWEYSEKTEAERLIHVAHNIATNFFRANNYKFSKNDPYNPTLKGTRVKEFAKLTLESEEFYKKLELKLQSKIFGLNGKTPEINKKPIESLNISEKLLMKLFIQSSNSIVSIDQIAGILSPADDSFSLYAISKTIQRLRDKLEANGIRSLLSQNFTNCLICDILCYF